MILWSNETPLKDVDFFLRFCRETLLLNTMVDLLPYNLVRSLGTPIRYWLLS